GRRMAVETREAPPAGRSAAAPSPASAPTPAAVPSSQAPAPQLPPQAAPARPAPRRRLRLIVLPILLVLLGAGGWFGWNTYRDGLLYVSTDHAQLTGQPIQVGAMHAGGGQS